MYSKEKTRGGGGGEKTRRTKNKAKWFKKNEKNEADKVFLKRIKQTKDFL